MWIVKIGGSLSTDRLLPQWLELLAQLGGGRVTIVPGGGGFADHVRLMQTQWELSDLSAHNMAVLAMAQTAYQFNAINPGLLLTSSKTDIRRVLQKGRVAVWLPLELQRAQADPTTNWDVTSDSIALDLARRLNAERLIVVKSCAIDPTQSLAQMSDTGVLDARFSSMSNLAPFPIDIVHKSETERVRALLLGETWVGV